MILVADSGASKTAWRLIRKDGSIEQYETTGFNPYYQSGEQLDRDVSEALAPRVDTDIAQIFYYGSGCSSDNNKKIIHDILGRHFTNAEIEVSHDLLAAARALCGHKPGIACILGTGANSCYFDGQHIVENVTSLGYVLGDEGSGAWFGKVLIADYLRKDLPQGLADRFTKRFGLDRNAVLDRVYHQEMPGRFLAGFARFIFQNIKDPWCYRLIYDGFSLFFDKNVMKYAQVDKVPVHFTGSIAFYFSNILRQVANDKGVVLKNIVEGPIAGLTLFHQKS